MRGITGSSLQSRTVYTKKPKKKICKNYTEGYQDYCGFCRMVYRQDKRRIIKKSKVKGPTLYNPKVFSKRKPK